MKNYIGNEIKQGYLPIAGWQGEWNSRWVGKSSNLSRDIEIFFGLHKASRRKPNAHDRRTWRDAFPLRGLMRVCPRWRTGLGDARASAAGAASREAKSARLLPSRRYSSVMSWLAYNR